jgi:hypothetical protein
MGPPMPDEVVKGMLVSVYTGFLLTWSVPAQMKWTSLSLGANSTFGGSAVSVHIIVASR